MKKQDFTALFATLSPAILEEYICRAKKKPELVDPALLEALKTERLLSETPENRPAWEDKDCVELSETKENLEALNVLCQKEDTTTPQSSQLQQTTPTPKDKHTPIVQQPFQPDVEGAHQEAEDNLSFRARMLIQNYRQWGHLQADLDPLKLTPPPGHPDLELNAYGLSNTDVQVPTFGMTPEKKTSVGTLHEALKKIYCRHIGFEYAHIQDIEERQWLESYIEGSPVHKIFSPQDKLKIFKRLDEAESFEHFLNKKFPGAKRFGLEGNESILVLLHEMIERSAIKYGAKESVLGMAHRGRLNVLCNLLKKQPRIIFKEFSGKPILMKESYGTGDVKYHLGASTDWTYGNQKIHLSLCANPSHLEAVNTVALGRVKAKQSQLDDATGDLVYGILLHGDAAFAGQGIVAETLLLSQLEGYHVGGTVHLIINNQIGFTTNPKDSRSSHYCSDVAKMIQAPVFHVNADDPESVAFAAQLAIDYRFQFKKDVILDICGYRRFGHNEMDEPSFTQPDMYAKIRTHPSVAKLYQKTLEDANVLEGDTGNRVTKEFNDRLQKEYELSETYTPKEADWLKGVWKGYDSILPQNPVKTGVPLKTLQELGKSLTAIPKTFAPHKTLKRQIDKKRDIFASGQNIDWGSAEAFAFGSLLLEGHSIRLSGQDIGRGTFSQRHAKWIDQKTSALHMPLAHLSEKQGKLDIWESPLSEMGVLGYEYGYSSTQPDSLVIWEAQFGDFANGAQVIIDQFISSAEAKWLRLSGLVMLLPHGYEGQGPEHSSARPERYLQLCAMNNMIVANCSTPANYFHILRQQILSNTRRPLMLMTPKSLLRHEMATSSFDEMGPGTVFRPVIPETKRDLTENTKVRRLILTSGKVYYDLAKKREALDSKDIALVRLEQFYPFPAEDLKRELSKYPKAQIVWCQEEPMNMGGWSFVEHRIEKVLTDIDHRFKRPAFIGRTASASPATGHLAQHNLEQDSLLEKALTISGKAG